MARRVIVLPPGLPVREWQRVTAGESGGAVYHAAGVDPLYLKYGSGAVASDIADEGHRLRWLAGRIACPRLRRLTTTPTEAWLVTDALPGRMADQWLADRPDAIGAIVKGCAAFLHVFHALPVDDCPFDAGWRLRRAAASRNVAAGRVDIDDFDADHAGMTAAAMLAKVEALTPTIDDRRSRRHARQFLIGQHPVR